MYVLDSDTTTHFFRGSNQSVIRKVLSVPRSDIWLPAIVAEEQLKGRLKFIAGLNAANPRDGPKLIEGYQYLIKTIKDLAVFGILPYTEEAEKLFRSWSPSERRRTHDSQIAAIAIVNNFTVITCNTTHFKDIPGIRIEDWSLEDVPYSKSPRR